MMYQQINPHLHQNFHNHSNHHHPQQQHNQAYPSIELQATTPIQHPQNQFVAHQNVQLLQQGQQIIQGYDQVNQVYTVQPQPIYYFPIFKQINEVIGDFSVSTMINISCYLAAFAILITYIVACSLGHQKWFPCMITSAGTDYPENIFFRIGLLTNIFYWLIMLVFEYWWLKAQSQALMNVVKVSSKMNLTAFIGFFFYGLTIATIDDGYIPTQFHGACAVIFFVLLCVYTQWNYYTVRQLRKLNPSFMSNSSFQRKRIFAYAWIFVFFFLILLALKFKWGLAVAEWIGTYSIIFYLQTFASDLKGFKLSVDDQQFTKHDMKVQLARNLEEKKQQEASQQINIIPTQQQQPQQQLYPVLQAAVPQNVVVVAQHNNHQLPQIQNRQHNNHKGQQETQHLHSQSFFQTHNHHREAAPQTQSHFQPNRVNAVNISESNSTADNSFMSIKKPLFSVNGQY